MLASTQAATARLDDVARSAVAREDRAVAHQRRHDYKNCYLNFIFFHSEREKVFVCSVTFRSDVSCENERSNVHMWTTILRLRKSRAYKY